MGRVNRRVGNHVELLVRVMTGFLALTASLASPLPPTCAHRAADRCWRGRSRFSTAALAPLGDYPVKREPAYERAHEIAN